MADIAMAGRHSSITVNAGSNKRRAGANNGYDRNLQRALVVRAACPADGFAWQARILRFLVAHRSIEVVNDLFQPLNIIAAQVDKICKMGLRKMDPLMCHHVIFFK